MNAFLTAIICVLSLLILFFALNKMFVSYSWFADCDNAYVFRQKAKMDGPHLLVVAGIHGNEHAGVVAAIQLVERLKKHPSNGVRSSSSQLPTPVVSKITGAPGPVGRTATGTTRISVITPSMTRLKIWCAKATLWSTFMRVGGIALKTTEVWAARFTIPLKRARHWQTVSFIKSMIHSRHDASLFPRRGLTSVGH